VHSSARDGLAAASRGWLSLRKWTWTSDCAAIEGGERELAESPRRNFHAGNLGDTAWLAATRSRVTTGPAVDPNKESKAG
jgi:hypothetical protein